MAWQVLVDVIGMNDWSEAYIRQVLDLNKTNAAQIGQRVSARSFSSLSRRKLLFPK
jgi:hypothetical protein